MDWQLAITLALIGAATGYLSWRGWRTWRANRKGCGGGCGCPASKPTETQAGGSVFIPQDQLRRRQ